MLILDEQEKPIILDDIHTPTVTDHFWVLDLSIPDYTLTPLLYLEETTAPAVQLEVHGFRFFLPTSWYVLIYDQETSYLDTVEVADIAGKDFNAMVYGLNESMVRPGHMSVVDYTPQHVSVSPSLNKHQLLCHPISPTTWINVSPSDSYNKYLKDIIVGDLI
jgi:hypothetical protein